MRSFWKRTTVGGCVAAAIASAALTASAAAALQPGDWKAHEDGSDLAEAIPLTEEDQRRYDAVARLLIKHITNGDFDSYRALFSDEGWETSIDWWKTMFEAQRARFGPIVKAYRPSREVVLLPGGVGFGPADGCAGFVVQFEDPAGGLLSIRLDDDGKITKTAAYVIGLLADYTAPAEAVIFDRAADENDEDQGDAAG